MKQSVAVSEFELCKPAYAWVDALETPQSLCWSPCGQFLAAGSPQDSAFAVWDIATRVWCGALAIARFAPRQVLTRKRAHGQDLWLFGELSAMKGRGRHGLSPVSTRHSDWRRRR